MHTQDLENNLQLWSRSQYHILLEKFEITKKIRYMTKK